MILRHLIPGFWAYFDGEDEGGGGGAPAVPAAAPKAGDPAPTPPAPAAAPAFDWGKWADGIQDENKRTYAKSFQSPEAVLDGALNLRKEISTRIKVPGKDAKPEDIAAFRNAIGAKEKAEDYKAALPENYELGEVQTALLGAMQKAAAETGVPATSFEGFTKTYFEFEKQVQAQVAQEVADYQRDSTAALKKDFGADFEKFVGVAENFVNQKLNVPEFTELLNDTVQWNGVSMQLRSHPAVIKMLARIGMSTAEDGVIGFRTEGETASLQKSINELEAKYPLNGRTKAQDAEIRALYEKLHG